MDWRVPPVVAETVVEFGALNEHVLSQRLSVEKRAWPAARRFAIALDLHDGIPSLQAVEDLEKALLQGVAATYRFGYESVERELRELRKTRTEEPWYADRNRALLIEARRARGEPPPLRASAVPDNPIASRGYVQVISRRAAMEFHDQLLKHWPKVAGDELARQQRIVVYAKRVLHNVVLALVGLVLNAGRTLAALGGDRPVRLTARVAPALYAMRSEQLDSNTCGPCDTEHGTIVEVGSDDYFRHMPPNLCLGRGRCRGIYVYGDSPADFRRAPGQLRLPEAS